MRVIITLFLVVPCLARAEASLNSFVDGGLDREQEAVRRYDLTRLRDQEHLHRFVRVGLLVAVPEHGTGFYLDPRIGGHADGNHWLYRYARAYTRRLIVRLGAQYHARFGDAFMVTSLVRTCRYQERLARKNANAVGCDETSHVTGATVDIHRGTMRPRAREWVRRVLIELEARELVQATEERGQPVFHVMVFPEYARYDPR